MMIKRPVFYTLIIFIFSLCLAQGCAQKQPINVGVVLELTGKQSELGINLRNGVMLAAEEINANGGIDGRQINLIVYDDLGTPQGAIDAENAVIDQGVVAVIGHLTSNQTVEGYKVAESRGVLLFSGTASTSVFNAKKDLFYRTEPSNDYFAHQFATYVHDARGISKIAIIYDIDNDTYSIPMADSFSEVLSSLGGEVSIQVEFSGSATTDFTSQINTLLESNPEGVFIIASPLNTSTIAQLLRLKGWNGPLFAAPWSQGQDLITNGGKAVEGLESINAVNINDPSPKFQEFKENYQIRFAETPAFTAVFGYELMTFLAQALQQTDGKAEGLGDALVRISTFQGLEGTIIMDEYGDSSRPLYILRLQDQQFTVVEEIEP